MGLILEKGRKVDVVGAIGDKLSEVKYIVFKEREDVDEVVTLKNYALDSEGADGVYRLYIEYIRMQQEGKALKEKECQKDFDILTPEGDTLWGRNLQRQVWGDDYPTTVAIDKYTGEVYEFHIYPTKLIEFRLFGKMTEEELEMYKEDINRESPYKMKLKEEAIYKYLEGEEGTRYLRENMQIELDCGVKLVVNKVK